MAERKKREPKTPISPKLGHTKKGRQTYEEKILPRIDEIRAWKENGEKIEVIAARLGLTTRQIYYHLDKPELAEAFHRKAIVLIEQLKTTLYDKALGRCKTKKTVIDQRTEMKDGKMVVTYEKKHVEITEHCPDLGALIFCLCNLDSANWKRSDREDVLEEIKIVLHDTIINSKKEANSLIKEAQKEIMSHNGATNTIKEGDNNENIKP